MNSNIIEPSDKASLTQVRLRELLVYDDVTGLFTWRDNRVHDSSNNIFIRAGTLAGHIRPCGRSSYSQIKVDNKLYRAHRLAWLYVYGHIPQMIDHIDGDGTNNAISNLRKCTPVQNGANRRICRRNTSGYKGATKCGNKWRALIKKDGKNYHLGLFDDVASAHAAYIAKAIELSGEFARAA